MLVNVSVIFLSFDLKSRLFEGAILNALFVTSDARRRRFSIARLMDKVMATGKVFFLHFFLRMEVIVFCSCPWRRCNCWEMKFVTH